MDLYSDNELLLIAQSRDQQDRSGTKDDSLVDDEETEIQNAQMQSDNAAGSKVAQSDSTEWRNAPIVDEDEAREQERRKSAMAELNHRYDRRKVKSQTIGYISVTLAAIFFVWNIIWHTGHWIWTGRKQ